jgi:drug/metabolite transporter (DMT)-like permease
LKPATSRSDAGPLVKFAPALFVFIWASGYVVAKLAAGYSEPLTFLLWRYTGVIALMSVLAAIARAPWPSSWRETGHIALAGICMQAGYLGGVWVAVRHGMPAGVAALIVNMQPVLTAVAGPLIGERVSARQWCGLAMGFAGVALVVSNKVEAQGITWQTVSLAVFALLAMTGGTLYQKRFCANLDLRTGQLIQFLASFAVTLPFVLIFESEPVRWTPASVGAMFWSVCILTGGGISLLYWMIRHGAATTVTSYMYLVPAVTAVMAWLMFGETFGSLAMFGMVVTIAGVALAVRRV